VKFIPQNSKLNFHPTHWRILKDIYVNLIKFTLEIWLNFLKLKKYFNFFENVSYASVLLVLLQVTTSPKFANSSISNGSFCKCKKHFEDHCAMIEANSNLASMTDYWVYIGFANFIMWCISTCNHVTVSFKLISPRSCGVLSLQPLLFSLLSEVSLKDLEGRNIIPFWQSYICNNSWLGPLYTYRPANSPWDQLHKISSLFRLNP